MKYIIRETGEYEVEARSPRQALEVFNRGLYGSVTVDKEVLTEDYEPVSWGEDEPIDKAATVGDHPPC